MTTDKCADCFGFTEEEPDHSMILEFKVQDEDEKELNNTVQEVLLQIEKMDYQANLMAKGIPEEHIRKYGFAFCGKKVLIGSVLESNRKKS